MISISNKNKSHVCCLLLPFIVVSCTSKNVDISNKPDLEIQMNIAKHRYVDLNKQISVTKFMSRRNDTVHFSLSETELRSIKQLYYNLGLDQIERDSLFVSDGCKIMPKMYTKMYIITGNKRQIFYGDTDCDIGHKIHGPVKRPKSLAKRVNRFMVEIESLILSKPEVKNAEKTDYLYM
jgi:hypothetical protein